MINLNIRNFEMSSIEAVIGAGVGLGVMVGLGGWWVPHKNVDEGTQPDQLALEYRIEDTPVRGRCVGMGLGWVFVAFLFVLGTNVGYVWMVTDPRVSAGR